MTIQGVEKKKVPQRNLQFYEKLHSSESADSESTKLTSSYSCLTAGVADTDIIDAMEYDGRATYVTLIKLSVNNNCLRHSIAGAITDDVKDICVFPEKKLFRCTVVP